MGDIDTEAEASIAGANSYYVRRKGVWQEFDTSSFTIGSRDAQLMVVQGDKLVLLEREQALRILRSGEGLLYVPIHVKKKDPELACRRFKKSKKKKKNKMEPLLHELNSHMALMNKILMGQWMDSAKSNVKEISENHSTPEPVEPVKNIAVSVDVHEQPAPTPEPIHSASSSEAPNVHSSPKSSSEGKKREFVVSPDSLQAISKFSQKHLDIIDYRGRNAVSPDTFDKDDDYCRMLLHKLNPVVELKRSLATDKVIKKCQRVLQETTGQKLPLNRFAATLGLVGAEKKQFMSDILEQRRHMRETVQKVQTYLETDGFVTDSSAADFELQPSGGVDLKSADKVETAKRKKTAPKRVSKRLKSDSSEKSFLPSSPGNSSDGKTRKLPRSKAAKGHDKENVKRRKTRSQSSITSEDEVEHAKKLPIAKSKRTDSKPLEQHRVLRTTNASKISENKTTQRADLRSSSSSPGKSPLKRPDLERVIEEDTSTTIVKQTQIKRLGEASPEKSPPALKKATQAKKTEGSQNSSKKLNASSNASTKSRTYSMLEDQAILDYLLKDNNSRLVKGTLMWKNLQKVFLSMTNQSRTWQSLKNRYLNYIMPELKYYGLPYDKEKLLRTGQYLGEITRKKKTSKENSIFKTQPVASASNALRLKNKPKTSDNALNVSDEAVASTSKEPLASTGGERGPATSTPRSERRARAGDPSYSEVTRRFARRHPPGTPSDDDEAAARPTRKLYNANA